jgi:uncharacterized repeat protein (TIGR01451 family)
MPKTARSKSKQSVGTPMPKYIYGAIIGALVGTLAVKYAPSAAINILIGLVVIAGYAFFVTRQRNPGAKWSPRTFSPAPVLGALVVGVTAIAGVQYLGISLAWHPQGVIKKTVQNTTDAGPVADANDNGSAVSAKTGDVLNYAITISNVADPAANHDNDMAFTVLKDTLPTGVELVSDPSKRTINENIGTILPGKSVTKTYQVKVTSASDNAYIKNEACFDADSVVKDNPQHGCDVAIIKVHVPPTPPAPEPVYSCDLLTLTKGDNRNVTATVTYTAKNGAQFKSATYSFGDTSQPVASNKTTVDHTYTKDGTYTVSVSLIFTVSGVDKSVTSAGCSKPVTIKTPTTPTPTPPTPTPPTPTPPTPETPTPTPTPTTPTSTPSELPNTGARSIIVVVLFTAVVGYLFSAIYGYNRGNKSIKFK